MVFTSPKIQTLSSYDVIGTGNWNSELYGQSNEFVGPLTSAFSLLNGKQILEHVVEHVIFGHCSSTLNLTLTFRSPFVRHLEVSDGVSEVKSGCYVRITIILIWYKKNW